MRDGTFGVRTDPTGEFFDGLASRGYEPLLRKVTGCVRFDVIVGERTEHWLVSIDTGDIRVSRGDGAADSVLRTGRESFDRLVVGELNLMAAVLRGEVALEGDPRLVVRLQRLFPRPVGGGAQRPAAGSGGREE